MAYRKLWVLLILLMLVGAACGPEEDEQPRGERETVLPNFPRQTDLALTAVVSTATARASITPSATDIVPTITIDPALIVTFTPRPTFELEDRDDILGNTYPQQSWLDLPFTTTDGVDRRLQSFLGSVVVVFIFNTDCSIDCLQMQRNLHDLAIEYQRLEDTEVVFVMLNTNSTISMRSLEFWATQNNIALDPELRWYVGTLSPTLSREMSDIFGEDMLLSRNLPLIVVDMQGASHITQNRVYTRRELNGVVESYLPFIETDEGEGPDSTESPSNIDNVLPPTPTATITSAPPPPGRPATE